MLESRAKEHETPSTELGTRKRIEPDTRLFSRLQFRNLLSFGPDTPALPMENLNVIIGPNGSGKSNFIELIQLLGALPTDLGTSFQGSQAEHWMWKGNANLPLLGSRERGQRRPHNHGQINATINLPFRLRRTPYEEQLLYQLELRVSDITGPRIIDESLIGTLMVRGKVKTMPYFDRVARNRYELYQYPSQLTSRTSPSRVRQLDRTELASEQSLLYQMDSSPDYPELARLSRTLGRIQSYREWSFGRTSILRQPQAADQRNDRIHEDLSNIYLILSRAGRDPVLKQTILKHLHHYASDVTGFEVVVQSGSVELYLHEGGVSFPASRLSDGALRYICLLTILCDPDPPPLICIEEPELGLHMDVLPPLVKLMQHASTKSQLVITTHSDILLDYLSDTPESVVVCQKVDGATIMQRITLTEYQRYRKIAGAGDDVQDSDVGLGLLWHEGFLGGVK